MASSDNSPVQKKRKFPWQKSYSQLSRGDVEKRIGISMTDLSTAKISPKDMLVKAEYSPDEDTIKAIKDEVYKKIVLHLDIEPAPTDHLHLMEANVHDLVLFIIAPIIYEFSLH